MGIIIDRSIKIKLKLVMPFNYTRIDTHFKPSQFLQCIWIYAFWKQLLMILVNNPFLIA